MWTVSRTHTAAGHRAPGSYHPPQRSSVPGREPPHHCCCSCCCCRGHRLELLRVTMATGHRQWPWHQSHQRRVAPGSLPAGRSIPLHALYVHRTWGRAGAPGMGWGQPRQLQQERSGFVRGAHVHPEILAARQDLPLAAVGRAPSGTPEQPGGGDGPTAAGGTAPAFPTVSPSSVLLGAPRPALAHPFLPVPCLHHRQLPAAGIIPPSLTGRAAVPRLRHGESPAPPWGHPGEATGMAEGGLT